MAVVSAEECPSSAVVERALRTRLPGAGVGTDGGWRLAYRWEQAGGAAGTLRMTLSGDGGRIGLERALVVDRAQCAPTAEAIAIIAERYFRELGWTAGRPLPAALVAPAPRRAVGSVAARLGIEAGAALSGTGPLALSPALRLEGRLFALSLASALPARARQEDGPDGGQATSSRWPLTLSMLAGVWGPSFGAHGGIAATAALEQARTVGITRPAEKTRVTVSAGPEIALTLLISARWRVLLDAAALRTLAHSAFVVQGWGTVLDPPNWQLSVALRAGLVFDL